MREVWIPFKHFMSSSSAAMAGGEKQRRRMMKIDKGRSFMGFGMIFSMDEEVLRGLFVVWIGINVFWYLPMELQRDKTR